ncbi:MAG TPA: hypothetical protein VJR06_01680, partial [Nitrososphaerales archaeon]|nr:hypothetical protein [Nitrososphaerales archaeon]
MSTRSEGGAPPQETSRTPAVKDLALPVLGGLIVAGLSGLYYAKVMVPLLSPFYIGNTYWTQLQGSGSLPLFGDLVLLGGRLGFGADGLAVAAASVCLVFSLSTYFLLTKSMGRWYVGLVGAAMLLFSPAFLSAIQYASYSVLLGLSLAFLSLHFAARLMKKASEWRLAVLTVLALATGLADPAIGQVLLATLLLMTPLAIWSGNSRFAAATALAAVVTLPALILVHPGPDLPWGNASSLLLLLAGGVASLAVYFNWKERSEGVLPLALLSVAAAGASAVLGTQYVFFALILTSAALAAKVWGLYGTTSDGGRRVSHLDLGKLAALLLVLLILGSDLGFALSSYRAATAEDSALAARYGSTGLIQAMSWLKQDTPTNSLILSEYPLSQWVQAVGDRPVISDSPQNSTLQSFYESYDANTMLNSTYELRNGYMRVRDWAPIAPQRSPS